MNSAWSRRTVLGMLAAGGAGFAAPGILRAQTAGGLLETLRKAKVVKIGIANQPPFSSLNPDNTVDGAAPTLVKTIMERLGVPKVEGIAVAYGQLIPGLQAGRWDMVGAAMTITKPRCEQVRYADPVIFDGAGFGYLKAQVPTPPASIKEACAKGVKIGVLTGGYLVPIVQSSNGNLTQYQDNPSLIDALLSQRIDVAIASKSGLKDLQVAHKNAFEVLYPLPDDVPHGSGPAFRPADTDLYEAFQAELAKMKKSGEAEKILKQFGFDVLPGTFDITAEKACSIA